MCKWILEVFHGIKNEDNEKSDDEPDRDEEFKGPHDCDRCEAGEKGTCKRCKMIKQRLN
jgi:hypothetical protein